MSQAPNSRASRVRNHSNDNNNGNGNGNSSNGNNDANCDNDLRPLRYTATLKCDPHLESLRPDRQSKHAAFEGHDQWRQKLIPPPSTYDGSFADADMQAFRPSPRPANDPWYTSRLPDAEYMPAHERLQAAPNYLNQQEVGPYDQVYPQDELSRIKMKNRRFQKSCAQEMAQGAPPSMPMASPATVPLGPAPYAPSGAYYPPPPPYGGHAGMVYPPGHVMPMRQPMMMPMMGMPPTQPQMMMMQQQQPQYAPYNAAQMMPQSDVYDLKMLDQELNNARRVARPYVPENIDYSDEFKKQRQLMDDPTLARKPRPLEPMPTSIDQLPAPKKSVRPSVAAKSPGDSSSRRAVPEAKVADLIAIRSIVLGKTLNRIGNDGSSHMSEATGTTPPRLSSSSLGSSD